METTTRKYVAALLGKKGAERFFAYSNFHAWIVARGGWNG